MSSHPRRSGVSVLGLVLAAGVVTAGLGFAGAAGAGSITGEGGFAPAATIHVRHISVGGRPYSATVDPRRHAAWVTTPQLVRISEVTQKVTARVRVSASAVAVDPGTGTVWTINDANGTMAEVSEATGKVIHRFPTLGFTRAIAIDPKIHAVWVTSGHYVLEYSDASRKEVRAVRLRPGADQVLGGLTADPASGTVWASVIPGDPRTSSCWVSEISEARHRVVHVYPGGCATSVITAVDSARGRAWLDFGSRQEGGTIEVVDIARRAVLRTFSGTPAAPEGLAIDPRARTVVATGSPGGGRRYTVLLISEASGKVVRRIPITSLPARVALDPGTGDVYVPLTFRAVVAEFRI